MKRRTTEDLRGVTAANIPFGAGWTSSRPPPARPRCRARAALPAGEGRVHRPCPPRQRGRGRARVSPPLLPLVAALWRSRAAEPRGLAVVVADDDAARTLIEAAAPYVPDAPAPTCPHGARSTAAARPGAAPGRRALRALDAADAGGLIAVSVDALLERVPGAAHRPRPVPPSAGSEPGREQLLRGLAAAGYTGPTRSRSGASSLSEAG